MPWWSPAAKFGRIMNPEVLETPRGGVAGRKIATKLTTKLTITLSGSRDGSRAAGSQHSFGYGLAALRHRKTKYARSRDT